MSNLSINGLDQGCKRDYPRPEFLSQSPIFVYLLVPPTQKRDEKPTQKPILSQPWSRPPFEIHLIRFLRQNQKLKFLRKYEKTKF